MHLCDTCGKTYLARKNLRRHMRIKHENLAPYRCCGKSFQDQSKLIRHRCVCHGEERRHRCESCTSSFATGADLKQHVARCHRETSIYCPICGKQFRCRRDLQDHMAIHNGEKPHRCTCGKSYAHNSNFYRHRRRCGLA